MLLILLSVLCKYHRLYCILLRLYSSSFSYALVPRLPYTASLPLPSYIFLSFHSRLARLLWPYLWRIIFNTPHVSDPGSRFCIKRATPTARKANLTGTVIIRLQSLGHRVPRLYNLSGILLIYSRLLSVYSALNTIAYSNLRVIKRVMAVARAVVTNTAVA
jgi:hypothetical protein